MDYRFEKRHSVNWDTLIFLADSAPLRGVIRDFSSGGVFIELPPHALNVQTEVTVSAVIGEASDMVVKCWPARVVHRTLTGLGLRFTERVVMGEQLCLPFITPNSITSYVPQFAIT